jgi:hypothetical protein
MTQVKPKRKIKILLLVEVAVSADWATDTKDGAPVAVHPRGGEISLDSEEITTRITESMRERWPDQKSWWPWYIKSVKQAVAP